MRTLAYAIVWAACLAALIGATSPWSFTAAYAGLMITGIYMIRGGRR